MEKIISIDGQEVGFKATASTIKRYRKKFNRDLLKELRTLLEKVNDEGNLDGLNTEDLETFERLAYIMAWQYDNTIPNSPDDWLDGFKMFSIYEILPQLEEIWGVNEETLETPKKKAEEQSGK